VSTPEPRSADAQSAPRQVWTIEEIVALVPEEGVVILK
jgi:hypothetical protein